MVRLASCNADIEEARALCRQWLTWHWDNYPADWPTEGNPMDPAGYEAVLRDLATLHARPLGAILIASLGGQPVGCVMYSQASPGVAELNRMFVNNAGRGQGIGRRLLDAMMDQMIQDGYRKAIFSSAHFLTHAKAMYAAAGFTEIPTPKGFPDLWAAYVYFMERDLRAAA